MEAILILKNLNAARPYYAVEIPGNPVSLSTFAYLKDARHSPANRPSRARKSS